MLAARVAGLLVDACPKGYISVPHVGSTETVGHGDNTPPAYWVAIVHSIDDRWHHVVGNPVKSCYYELRNDLLLILGFELLCSTTGLVVAEPLAHVASCMDGSIVPRHTRQKH